MSNFEVLVSLFGVGLIVGCTKFGLKIDGGMLNNGSLHTMLVSLIMEYLVQLNEGKYEN